MPSHCLILSNNGHALHHTLRNNGGSWQGNWGDVLAAMNGAPDTGTITSVTCYTDLRTLRGSTLKILSRRIYLRRFRVKKVLPLLLLLFLVVGNAFSQTFHWAKQAGANLIDVGNAIAVDTAGNSYVTGFFTGTITFPLGVSLTSAGGPDIFVAKYNPAGAFLWARQAKGLYNDWGNAISVDAAGNAYVTGIVGGGTVQFSSTQSITTNQDDIFIAKYNAGGVLQWVLQGGGGPSIDYGSGIAAISATGDFYVTGVFNGTATFNTTAGPSTTLTSNGSGDIFIAKYNTNGVLQWVRGAGGANPDYGVSIGVDALQNAYVTGTFSSSFTWGVTPLTPIGAFNNGFVTKYSPGGSVLWVRTMGGSINDGGTGISVDSSGGPYVIGYYQDSLLFSASAISLNSAGSNNKIFIARYDTNGLLVWVQSVGGLGNNTAGGIFVRGAGGPYVTGAFSGTASFGSQSLTSSGTQDIFVAHYDPCGQLLWVRKAGGAQSDFGNGIGVDGAGHAYITGGYQSNPASFPGTGSLTNSNTATSNFFVAEIH
jgi:hypothetical protein